MHPLYRITHLGRPLEPRYATNRATLILMGIAFVAGAVQAWLTGGGVLAALAAGALAMLTVFFTWALGRELAPDDNPAAFIGVALSAIAWVALGRPDVLLVATSVGFSRLTARTVGEPCMMRDTVLVVVLATALTLWLGKTAIGIGAALALALDALLPSPRRLHLPLALVPVTGVVVHLARHGLDRHPLGAWRWAFGALTAVTMALIVAYPKPQSTCDMQHEPLHLRRLQSGVFVTGVMALWSTLVEPPAAAAPLWAALAGVALGRLAAVVRA
jgi:hypothetical protein